MKGRRIQWSPEELTFIERRKTWERTKLHAAFVRKFRRSDVSVVAIGSLCKRKRWHTGPRAGRFKGRLRSYSAAEFEFIKSRITVKSRTELHAEFVLKFNRPDVTLSKFIALCKNQGLRSGRNTQFQKGAVPANKGKKMPFNANSARTQFKKGSRGGRAADLYQPIGSERFHRSGYLQRKIHDGLPMQSRWRFVHLIEWEKVHGPLPAGMVLKCKGDRSNTDPSNWEMVPRGLLPRLNGKGSRGRDYDQAPAELKPTIMAVAKLEHCIRNQRTSP